MMYEHRTARLLPRRLFIQRVVRHGLIVVGLIGVSLLAGMIGYVTLAGMTWVDAFLNTAMLLGGMGEMGDLPNNPAKIFAGLYALYAGLLFVVCASILVAPVAHRLLHKLHVEKGK